MIPNKFIIDTTDGVMMFLISKGNR